MDRPGFDPDGFFMIRQGNMDLTRARGRDTDRVLQLTSVDGKAAQLNSTLIAHHCAAKRFGLAHVGTASTAQRQCTLPIAPMAHGKAARLKKRGGQGLARGLKAAREPIGKGV